MKRRIWKWQAAAALLVMALAAGCGGGKKATPDEVFNGFLTTLKNGEFEKVYDMHCKAERDKMDGQAKKLSETLQKVASKPEQVEKMKKLGVTDEQLKEVKGKDVVRVSLAMSQMMAEMFTPKGKTPPDIIKEMKAEIEKTKVLSTEISKDGKTAKIQVQTAKGKKKENVLILEDEGWKLAEVEL